MQLVSVLMSIYAAVLLDIHLVHGIHFPWVYPRRRSRTLMSGMGGISSLPSWRPSEHLASIAVLLESQNNDTSI
jgi:hypothetical protein